MYGNLNLDKVKEMKDKLSQYLLDYGDDDMQIKNTLLVLDTFVDEAVNDNYETAKNIAEPILKSLSNANKLDFYDIRILATVVDYAGSTDKTYKLAERLLKALERYSGEERYLHIKRAIHMNVLVRLQRAKAKYFDSDDLISPKELERRFNKHFDAIMEICDIGKFPIHKAIAIIRKGLFYESNKITNKGFEELEKTGQEEVYEMMRRHAENFAFFVGTHLSRFKHAKILGANVRKRRKEMLLTHKKMAEALGISVAYVGLIERGERTPSVPLLQRICDLLNISVNYLHEGVAEAKGGGYSDRRKDQLNLLDTYVQQLTNDQVDFVITMVKELNALNQPKAEQIN